MSYPREHESIVRASYSTLIERGINPSLAVLVSEIMGRDAAGIERSQRVYTRLSKASSFSKRWAATRLWGFLGQQTFISQQRDNHPPTGYHYRAKQRHRS